ncbi:IclR family transcriptional regulator [Microbulbifer sp. S227A]|uniref:IclR family transcriptional regulator n=1 Tax=Microbulbifer sp. S227A TaxID=3415131 RepID=UPI003C7CA22E
MPESSILTKAMAILDLVAGARAALTLAEITDMSGLPRSSAHRLLVLLRDAEALAYDSERQTYSPGPRLMRWGVQTQTTRNLATVAAPHMNTLGRDTGLRVALSVLDARSVLFVHTNERGAPFRLAPRVGQHSPLHATAAGKLFLAGMSDERRDAVLAQYDFEGCTEFTITDAPALRAEIARVREQGFAVSAREEFRQICGIAVPILDDRGQTLAALSLWSVGEDDLMTRLAGALADLRRAALAIAVGFGQSPA